MHAADQAMHMTSDCAVMPVGRTSGATRTKPRAPGQPERRCARACAHRVQPMLGRVAGGRGRGQVPPPQPRPARQGVGVCHPSEASAARKRDSIGGSGTTAGVVASSRKLGLCVYVLFTQRSDRVCVRACMRCGSRGAMWQRRGHCRTYVNSVRAAEQPGVPGARLLQAACSLHSVQHLSSSVVPYDMAVHIYNSRHWTAAGPTPRRHAVPHLRPRRTRRALGSGLRTHHRPPCRRLTFTTPHRLRSGGTSQ